MTNDPDQQRKPEQHDQASAASPQFGWHPDVSEPTAFEKKQANPANDAQPAAFSGASLIGDIRPDSPAYWTPIQPGELPPTIINRKAPPAHEMLGRYGKPAMMALTVAAVSSAGLWQSAQTAMGQASDANENDEASNIRPADGEQQPQLFQLLNDSPDASGEQAPAAAADRTEPFIYPVERGDWVRHIAQDFGLQTMTVVWNNNLPDPDFILPGQELLILPVDGVMVEVQSGETLNSLATAFGVSTTAIINYEPNGIQNPDLIQPGQILIIPGGVPPVGSASQPAESAPPPPTSSEQTTPASNETDQPPTAVEPEESVAEFNGAGESVTVEAGDTVASIAELHGVTVDELIQVNDLADVNAIYPGDVLYLPAGVEAQIQPNPELEPEPAPQPDPEPAPEPVATAIPEPDPQPAPAPDPTPEPAPDPTPTPTPAPEPTATSEPEPTPTPAPPPASSGPPSDIPGLLTYYANQYGLDPNLVKAVAWQESRWNQSTISSAGAMGVMQVMPGTATWVNNNLVSRDLDVRGNVADNIEAGTAYLAHRIDQFGDVERGLAAYYMGPATVQNHGITAVGRNYVDGVLRVRDYIATHGEPPR